jgi:hypothetical protein
MSRGWVGSQQKRKGRSRFSLWKSGCALDVQSLEMDLSLQVANIHQELFPELDAFGGSF